MTDAVTQALGVLTGVQMVTELILSSTLLLSELLALQVSHYTVNIYSPSFHCSWKNLPSVL